MKLYNSKIIVLCFTLGAIFFTSCKKSTFTDANNNPNAPQSVVPSVILPVVEISLAYTQGGDYSRFATLLVQQSVGFSRQSQAYYQYVLTSADFDTEWGNMYTSVLGNNQDLLDRSDAGGYNVYGGISRIIMAYGLQLLVDTWGDVPYSSALKGNEQTQPTYDKGSDLYNTIINLLDKAISQLNDPDPGALTPSTDDIIYGGDVDKWLKFAHAIKARIYIHQSKGDASMAAKALEEANMAFESNADNAEFIFGNTETSANPVYQFNEQRTDIDYASGALVDIMNDLNDPRLTIYTTPDYSDLWGAGIGSYYGSINSPVELVTYEEVQFIKAEATLRSSGDVIAAQTFYQEGIRASMEKLGVSNAEIVTYLTANGTLPAGVDAAISKVAVQEYLALFLNPEAFTVWRRTGSPSLTPISGTNGIPRRFVYPQTEISLNGGNVPQATLFTPKIFWDK